MGEYLLLLQRLNLLEGGLKSAVVKSSKAIPMVRSVYFAVEKLEEGDDPDAAVGKFDLIPPKSYSPQSRPEDSEGPTNGQFQPQVGGPHHHTRRSGAIELWT